MSAIKRRKVWTSRRECSIEQEELWRDQGEQQVQYEKNQQINLLQNIWLFPKKRKNSDNHWIKELKKRNWLYVFAFLSTRSLADKLKIIHN